MLDRADFALCVCQGKAGSQAHRLGVCCLNAVPSDVPCLKIPCMPALNAVSELEIEIMTCDAPGL